MLSEGGKSFFYNFKMKYFILEREVTENYLNQAISPGLEMLL